jgi:hypothetical protein
MTERDKIVEIAARAIYASASGEERPDFDRQPASVKRFYFKQATAALAALEQAGYVLNLNKGECICIKCGIRQGSQGSVDF